MFSLPHHHWFPHKMTSEKKVQKFHSDDDSSLTRSGEMQQRRNSILMMHHYPDLSIASIVMHQIQYGISAPFRQTPFCWETSGDVTKCLLFSQVTAEAEVHFHCKQSIYPPFLVFMVVFCHETTIAMQDTLNFFSKDPQLKCCNVLCLRWSSCGSQ